MRQVIIHIGPPKTGSTSIQGFLNLVQDELLGHGVLYPREGRLKAGVGYRVFRRQGAVKMTGPADNHQLLAWALRQEVEGINADRCWNEVLQEIQTVRPHTVILSGEDFFSVSEEKVGQFKKYVDGFRVTVLCYLRNPFDLLLSIFKQRVKAGRYYGSFEDFLQEESPKIIRTYEASLQAWCKAFGVENVVFKVFDKIKRNPGLEYDLLNTLKINPASFEEAICTIKRLNVSPSDDAIHLVRLVNFLEHTLGRPEGLKSVFSRIREKMANPGSLAKGALSIGGPLFQKPVIPQEKIGALKELTKKQWNHGILEQFLQPDDRQYVEIK